MNKTNQKIKRLKKKLDRLIQEKYVAENPYCIVCSQPTSEMHHFIQKSLSMNLRWDDDNLVPVCKRCHTLHHKSGDPRIHQIILKKKGHEWADMLELKRRVTFKPTLGNLQEVERLLDGE